MQLDWHVPWTLQNWPPGQLPQLPLHPSEPHCLPKQLGWQDGWQFPLTQLDPAGQFPQVPPQPSDPHCFPEQLGKQPPVQVPQPIPSTSSAQIVSHSTSQQ